MSAQAYINKRRILAEASLVKAQYTKGLAVNRNSIYASRNCIPTFQKLAYNPACKCPFNGRGIYPPLAVPIFKFGADGGNANTNINDVDYWLDGGNAGTSKVDIPISGGEAGLPIYYNGGNAFTSGVGGIDGGQSGLPIYYTGGNAFSSGVGGIDGGKAL